MAAVRTSEEFSGRKIMTDDKNADQNSDASDESLNLSAVRVTDLLRYFITGNTAATAGDAPGVVESIVRSLLVVVPTYLLAALGLRWNGAGIDIEGPDVPYVVAAVVVLIFTLSHGVVPVFFYAIFNGVVRALRNASNGAMNFAGLFVSGFLLLHMGIWYGSPIIILGLANGWYAPAWTVFGVVTAKRGERQWVFLEHGSTAMSLMLFQFLLADFDLIPHGLVVVLMQAILLTLAEWKGKALWIHQ